MSYCDLLGFTLHHVFDGLCPLAVEFVYRTLIRSSLLSPGDNRGHPGPLASLSILYRSQFIHFPFWFDLAGLLIGFIIIWTALDVLRVTQLILNFLFPEIMPHIESMFRASFISAYQSFSTGLPTNNAYSLLSKLVKDPVAPLRLAYSNPIAWGVISVLYPPVTFYD
jgi:hypothetical protein